MASSNPTSWSAGQYHNTFAQKDLHYSERGVKCNCNKAEYNLAKCAATSV